MLILSSGRMAEGAAFQAPGWTSLSLNLRPQNAKCTWFVVGMEDTTLLELDPPTTGSCAGSPSCAVAFQRMVLQYIMHRVVVPLSWNPGVSEVARTLISSMLRVTNGVRR